jgi:2'-5' RNA ligase
LFFALWPNHALQAALADATRDVVFASGGRAVPPENFHITLAFLGSVAKSSVAKVEAVGDRVAAEVERTPVLVTLDAIEYWKKANVVCATARVPLNAAAPLADTRAGTLATALQSRLTADGFTPDLKPFRPHVTLARKDLRLLPTMDIDPVVWSFTEFALVESRTKPEGARYQVLRSFPLVNQQS